MAPTSISARTRACCGWKRYIKASISKTPWRCSPPYTLLSGVDVATPQDGRCGRAGANRGERAMGASNRERWLAEPEWLADHLGDPRVRIVDMRGVVKTTTEPDGSQHADY